jgi:hypothetical protein
LSNDFDWLIKFIIEVCYRGEWSIDANFSATFDSYEVAEHSLAKYLETKRDYGRMYRISQVYYQVGA